MHGQNPFELGPLEENMNPLIFSHQRDSVRLPDRTKIRIFKISESEGQIGPGKIHSKTFGT